MRQRFDGRGVRRLDHEEATNLRKIPPRFEIKVTGRQAAMLAPRSLFAAELQHSESALLYCKIFLRHKTLPFSAFLLRCHSGSTSLRLGLHQTDLSHIGADRLAGDLQLICQRGARSSEEDHEQGSFHPRRFLKGHHAERNCTLIHNSHQRRLVQIKGARSASSRTKAH